MTYRMLKKGEPIKYGDEFLRHGRWILTKQPGQLIGFNELKYRRRVAHTSKNITTLDFLVALYEVQREGVSLFRNRWTQWEESVLAADLLDRVFFPGSGWPWKIIDRKLLKDAEFLKEVKTDLSDCIALGMRMDKGVWPVLRAVADAQELLDKTL